MASTRYRMVMVGKTGAGKSATGNTILGFEAFESAFNAESHTVDCKKKSGVVNGREVSVVDTPGLFDTRVKEAIVVEEIKQCICFAAPGPHVFLLVIRLGRFTTEEQITVKIIQTLFGEMSNKYTMILFTGGDQFKLDKGETVENFLKMSSTLQELIRKCGGGYHVFNNGIKDPSQVTELLLKIDLMVDVNGGSYYTTGMFQEAERAIREEQQRYLKDNEGPRYKELERQMKRHVREALIQAQTELKRKHQEEARKQAETNNPFLSSKNDGVLKAAKALVAMERAATTAKMGGGECKIQ